MGKNDAKSTRAARAGSLIAGARKRFPNGGQTLTFGGGAVTVTVDAVVKELQTLIDNRAATTAAQAAARDKVKAEREQAPALVAFMKAFEDFVRFAFGADTAALADFGLPPRKERTPKKAVDKAVAAAKAKATRVARGTKGPVARQDTVGTVNATAIEEAINSPTESPIAKAGPAAPPAAAAPAAAPAASASAAAAPKAGA